MSKANPEPGVLRFPLSRVKRIIKTDTEVKLISTDACVLIAKASVCVCVCASVCYPLHALPFARHNSVAVP
jgi:Histone-like transcription factor (CBF/NF-Y) and archaeal histone